MVARRSRRSNPVTVICNVLRDLTLGGPTTCNFLQSLGWIPGITLGLRAPGGARL